MLKTTSAQLAGMRRAVEARNALWNEQVWTFLVATCLLQRVSPDMERKEVIQLEETWKDRLHTRHPSGLNAGGRVQGQVPGA